jgi:hypothetical protein
VACIAQKGADAGFPTVAVQQTLWLQALWSSRCAAVAVQQALRRLSAARPAPGEIVTPGPGTPGFPYDCPGPTAASETAVPGIVKMLDSQRYMCSDVRPSDCIDQRLHCPAVALPSDSIEMQSQHAALAMSIAARGTLDPSRKSRVVLLISVCRNNL